MLARAALLDTSWMVQRLTPDRESRFQRFQVQPCFSSGVRYHHEHQLMHTNWMGKALLVKQ